MLRLLIIKACLYKDFGADYSGDAIAAFRWALLLCGPQDVEIKERCESEIRIIESPSCTNGSQGNQRDPETEDKTVVIPREELTLLHNEIDDLKALILAVQRSVEQLVRKVDRT
jgi:hypothetical protein